MRSVLRALGSSKRLRRGRLPSATPGPVLSVGSLCAKHIASEALSLFNRHRSFGAQQLRCEARHKVSRSAGSVRKSSAPGCSGLPVLRQSAHRWLPVAAAQMQIRGCALSWSSRTLAAMQCARALSVGSASCQVTLARLGNQQRKPNHSVKRTAPGVPGSAAYLKR